MAEEKQKVGGVEEKQGSERERERETIEKPGRKEGGLLYGLEESERERATKTERREEKTNVGKEAEARTKEDERKRERGGKD